MAEVKKTKKTAAKTKTVKPLKAVKAKAILSAEDNLKKLSRSKLPMLFVKKHEGSWNHQDWLDFLADIKARGYDPINTDYVGLILEEKKAQYLASR
ncbi:MAG: hypothetical protein J6C30_00590 [Lentisphaeria bacterium]|nr:hypothetical protein [Lentisphaeria bacterium]